MRTIAIAIASDDLVVGDGKTQPFHIAEDMDRFRLLTTGKHVVMGRKTYEAIGGTLPNRTNVIVSKTMDPHDGLLVARDAHEALDAIESIGAKEVFVIGGGQLWRSVWDRVNQVELTRVHSEATGDVTLPALDDFTMVWRNRRDGYDFETWVRM